MTGDDISSLITMVMVLGAGYGLLRATTTLTGMIEHRMVINQMEAHRSAVEGTKSEIYKLELEQTKAELARLEDQNKTRELTIVVHSDQPPPKEIPEWMQDAESAMWVQSEKGTMKVGAWIVEEMPDDTSEWHQVAGKQYGNMRHILSQKGDTLIGLRAVSSPDMQVFSDRIEDRKRKNPDLRYSDLYTWEKFFLDKNFSAEARAAVVDMLGIVDDRAPLQNPATARRVDLS